MMYRMCSTLCAALGIVLLISSCSCLEAAETMRGTIIGRSEGNLRISVPYPVREGTVFVVKLLPKSPIIAEARTISCTTDFPFVATAKIVRGDIKTQAPIGGDAYADETAVQPPDSPKPLASRPKSDGARLSVQAGAFQPESAALRESLGDHWNAYRLNYSFLKYGNFETLLSAEYASGEGQVASNAGPIDRKMEMLPLTVLGKIRPLRIGGTSLFLGGGGGMYYFRTQDRLGLTSTEEVEHHPGYELLAGLESRRGWILEMRYRDVPELNLSGYSLTAGARF